MSKDLTTNFGFIVGLGPGEAVEFRAGEVLTFPDEIADRLLKRSGVFLAPAKHDLRHRSFEECLLPADLAAKLSPRHDPAALEHEARRASSRMLADHVALQNKILSERAGRIGAK